MPREKSAAVPFVSSSPTGHMQWKPCSKVQSGFEPGVVCKHVSYLGTIIVGLRARHVRPAKNVVRVGAPGVVLGHVRLGLRSAALRFLGDLPLEAGLSSGKDMYSLRHCGFGIFFPAPGPANLEQSGPSLSSFISLWQMVQRLPPAAAIFADDLTHPFADRRRRCSETISSVAQRALLRSSGRFAPCHPEGPRRRSPPAFEGGPYPYCSCSETRSPESCNINPSQKAACRCW